MNTFTFKIIMVCYGTFKNKTLHQNSEPKRWKAWFRAQDPISNLPSRDGRRALNWRRDEYFAIIQAVRLCKAPAVPEAIILFN